MAEQQNFRSAFHGFNREDVVHYIEYLNNRHNAQVGQLRSELQAAQAELAQLRGASAPEEDPRLPQALTRCAALEQELSEAQARCAALEQTLTETKAQLAALQAKPEPAPERTEEELEAYRRAERTERLAQARAAQLCAQVNGVLADVTVKVDEAAAQVGAIADQVSLQVGQLQAAVAGSKASLQDAATILYTIHPAEPEE